MNPQDGEGNNNQPPAANAANPLDKLENAVAAAKEEAAAGKTPMEQFTGQFGSGLATPPAAESNAPDLMGQALGGLGTTPPAVDASTPQPEQTQPAAEALAQPEPEQTPAEKLKQQIADIVDAFLEEVTRDKVAA